MRKASHSRVDLKGRQWERPAMVRSLEALLHRDGGGVVPKLKPGEVVVLLFSGGVDSLVAAEWLLRRGVVVYGLYVDKWEEGSGRGARRAAVALDEYLGKKYPKMWRGIEQYELPWLPQTVARQLARERLGFFAFGSLPAFMQGNTVQFGLASWGLDMVSAMGAVYARVLLARRQVKVAAVVCGITADDGLTVYGQTLTHVRMMQVWFRMREDGGYGFFSPFMEPALGQWLGKREVVALGRRWRLPLELTWSCTAGDMEPCGRCNSCLVRQELGLGEYGSAGKVRWWHRGFRGWHPMWGWRRRFDAWERWWIRQKEWWQRRPRV